MKSSCHSPRSPTVPQPRRSTLVDSTNTRPAPPVANLPKFTKCQSVGNPFTAAYWCIGATTTRFLSTTDRIFRGVNSNGIVMRVTWNYSFLVSPLTRWIYSPGSRRGTCGRLHPSSALYCLHSPLNQSHIRRQQSFS